jgi:glucosamine-6-phosphate deaminase
MRNLDAVVCDLEWQRLRRRVALNPAEAMLLNCGTWAVIAFLKLVSR